MNRLIKTVNKYLISGVVFGVVGFLYYANFRQAPIYLDFNPLFSLFKLTSESILLPRYIDEWIPSFLHVIGMSLFTFGLYISMATFRQSNTKLLPNLHIIIPVFWLVTDLLFEFGQAGQSGLLITAGNFEWMDVTALIVATLLSIYLLSKSRFINTEKTTPTSISKIIKSAISEKLAITVALLVGSYTMLGSYLYECESVDGYVGTCWVTPIYASKDVIREMDEIFVSTNRVLNNGNLPTRQFNGINNAGKIYVYGDILFINELYDGTYVFDNSDPSVPQYLAYIRLIGNQDIVIHNNILYLDSFMDIVAIDLNNIITLMNNTDFNDISIIRNIDMIEQPNMEEFLPEYYYFKSGTDDQSDSIIIGYTTATNSEYYFWDIEL
jgi:hypothetical protein